MTPTRFKPGLILLILFFLSACTAKQSVPTIKVVWEMGRNGAEPGYFENTFHITNTGKEELLANWVLYFCQLPTTPKNDAKAPFVVEEICSTLNRLYPSENYTPIPAGATVSFSFLRRGALIKETNAPRGAYLVFLDEEGNETGTPIDIEIEVVSFEHDYQWTIPNGNKPPYASGERIYEDNLRFQQTAQLKPSDIFPSVKQIDLTNETLTFTKDVEIFYPQAFKSEASLLADNLSADLHCSVRLFTAEDHQPQYKDGATTIIMEQTDDNSDRESAYNIEITPRSITLYADSDTGIFYASQSLLAILGNHQSIPCRMECMHIYDYPDLAYRGFMLDVARNFTNKKNLLKLIDLLAFYKLNTLHLHLGDDEGWRLEINELEELTQVGALRGHTHNEQECMYPQYNGGWNPHDPGNTGCGFYSKADYIEILQYAQKRHIRVIPEFDMPGHSRAAIKAMNVRYHKHKDSDPQKATNYLLTDFADTSRYYSAQGYTDNVINVALPSVYNFVYKLIDELESIHKEAGCPLKILHLGGDEVPRGCWEGSALCRQFMHENNMKEVRELKDYFISKILDYTDAKGIQIGGWQEVSLLPDGSVNDRFKGRNILSYCWSNIAEWNTDQIPYSLANAGFPVVLSNVANLYLDMPYSTHEDEPGLHWGGFVDEYTTFDVLPFDIYRSLRKNLRGQTVDIVNAGRDKVQLNPLGHTCIQGIQGQLWNESIRNYEGIERCLFPKLFGLVERAWNATPKWAEQISDQNIYLRDLNQYNSRIVLFELPRLEKRGVNYRIPHPGIKLSGGMLYCNSSIPGVEIRYTTDGSDPNSDSPIWSCAVPCDAQIIKAIALYCGKTSVITRLNAQE